jgi:hypothetical protein
VAAFADEFGCQAQECDLFTVLASRYVIGAHKCFSRVVAAAVNYAGMANWQMPKPDANGCWDVHLQGADLVERRSMDAALAFSN